MGGGAMQAIAKLHGPDKPSYVGVSGRDPQLIARPVRPAAMEYFFRLPNRDHGERWQCRVTSILLSVAPQPQTRQDD